MVAVRLWRNRDNKILLVHELAKVPFFFFWPPPPTHSVAVVGSMQPPQQATGKMSADIAGACARRNRNTVIMVAKTEKREDCNRRTVGFGWVARYCPLERPNVAGGKIPAVLFSSRLCVLPRISEKKTLLA